MARRALLTFLLFSTFCLAQVGTPAQKRNGSISGSVVRADNSQPIKRAKVSLEPAYDESLGAVSAQDAMAAYKDRHLETETDETGHFSFTNVPPGNYQVFVEKIGFVNERPDTRYSELLATVPAGAAAKDITLKLKPGGAITGRVLNEDGDPMANTTVEAMRYRYFQGKRKLVARGQAETNDLGEYRIYGLSPQKYYLRADPRGESGYATAKHSNAKPVAYSATFYPNAKSAADATRLDVNAGDEQSANFSLAPGPAFTVSGKILGLGQSSSKGGAAYQIAMLMGENSYEPVGTAMVSAKDPTFVFEGVPPGEYKLVAFSADVDGGQTMVNERVGHESVTVASSDLQNLVLALQEAKLVQVNGRVRFDPSPGSSVDPSSLFVTLDTMGDHDILDRAFTEMGDTQERVGRTGEVGSDGTFKAKISSAAPSFQPRLNARSHAFEDYYTKSVLLGGRDVTESGIAAANITPGATLELIVSPYGGRVEGVVLDSNKKPVVGAFVACVPETKLRARRELYVTDTTNQQGHYVLRGLRPGSYKLYAFDEVDPGAIYSSEFLKPFEDMGESIEVKEKDAITKPLQLLHQTED